MKKNNIFVSIMLCLACVMCVFGVTGCGGTSIKTIAENFAALDAEYDKYSNIFESGEIESLQTNYKVNFGPKINTYVDGNQGNFGELRTVYNAALVISEDYIHKNRDYILGLEDDELTSEAKQQLNELNSALTSYTKEIQNFVKARESLQSHFDDLETVVPSETNESVLRDFKAVFGSLVEKNVKLSISLAQTIEATEIFELLKKVDPQPSDIGIVKEFMRARMLHLFTDLPISEISNKMTWSAQAAGDCKARIDQLLSNLNLQYSSFKQKFVLSKAAYKQNVTKESFTQLLDLVNEFFVEADAFTRAVEEMDFRTLAVTYKNDLAKYVEDDNEFGYVYLEKMEQFVSITLPSFMNNIAQLIYQA